MGRGREHSFYLVQRLKHSLLRGREQDKWFLGLQLSFQVGGRQGQRDKVEVSCASYPSPYLVEQVFS